eukprot:2475427-Pyramimonas_sp.AAC.1
MNVPTHIRLAVASLCHNVKIDVFLAGLRGHRYLQKRGIQQGRTLSGSLFSQALDTILRMMCLNIPRSLGAIRAFADD